VGIDAYEPPVPPLRGCVNDIRRVESLLATRARTCGDRFHSRVLTDAEATRPAIIEGFREHLRKAMAQDVALFYYSGHGSQAPSPPEFWHLEPDRLDETLVCHDSRKPGAWDLADKELAHLIAEVAANHAHVVVILDSCHSGSGTRNADITGVRRVPTDQRQRPLSEFLSGLEVPASRAAEAGQESGWVHLPQGRHILLAACRSDEEAKEYSLGGKPHGVFSHFLGETLEQARAVTYRELFKRVNALVRSHAALQSPQIEATDHAILDENFLGGATSPTGQHFTLSHDAVAGWVTDAGAVHGIPQPSGGESAVFAIFPQSSDPARWRDMKNALGTARVRRVEAPRSAVEVKFTQGEPGRDRVYKAVLVTLPLAPLAVAMEGDAAGLKWIRAAFSRAGATGGPSLLVRESEGAAELRVVALEGGGYRILRPADGRRLVGDSEGFTEESAAKTVARLEHIARWMRITELRNPAGTLGGRIVLEVYTVSGDAAQDARPVEGTSLRLAYTRDETGKWRRPKIKVRLINRSDAALHCALVGLTETFAVQTQLLPGGSVRLDPGQEAWANAGKPISTEVSDALWKAGLIEVRDVLKLIASTAEFDATLLEQGELDHPLLERAAETRGIGVSSTLGRVMKRVQTRGFSTDPEEDEVISDWTTQEFTFTTVRPLESVEVSRAEAAEIYPGVRLLSHPALRANARLTAVPVASRDVAGGFVLPFLLRDDPSVSQPFLLSTSRGGAPGLSVLELFNVEKHETVTPHQPLRLQIAQALAPGEHLLPFTHDGEFYLPIGRGMARDGHVDVVLNAIPAPQNTRSLFGAVRIFFQKVISQHFGTEYKHPLLAAFSFAPDGATHVTMESGAVRALVAKADRIVLYIHGIIGETAGMAASAAGLAGPPVVAGLRDRYDLILTFDYENLHTSIDENARLLKQRLVEVGLGPGHRKTLHIVAHSMGGLVSRWFIEREGGNQVAGFLAMLGTPNGGSPWSTIEDWAIAALSLGLNGLAAIAWPARILGGLVGAVEKIDVALDQMKPGSDFLKALDASPAPGIPYAIIAGNTSLVSAPNADRDKARRGLLARLKSLNLLHLATAPAFFGEPNDIAVSVENIRRQPPRRVPEATLLEVACDHLTYFSTPVGLSALSDALPRPRRSSP
jgi:hypothetical protein